MSKSMVANHTVQPLTRSVTAERLHWEQRYRDGPRPWDTRITPPEVQAFWADAGRQRSGLALDLGCGPGTNVAYLARLGLHALGVDLAGLALIEARKRLANEPQELRQRTSFVQADVTRLPFHSLGARYILDIGCLHGIPNSERAAYARGVINNLASGGHYHLFAFDRIEGEEPSRRGMGPNEVEQLFWPHLSLVQEERGQPDRQPCRWYLLVKP
jgi:SAM-dependent methyltransferase